MHAPQMTVKEYLGLLDVCSVPASSPAYSLVNQDVRKGKVYFTSEKSYSNLYRLLQAAENGTKPLDVQNFERKMSERAAENSAKLDLNKIELLQETNSDGYLHGRCPVCHWEDNNTAHTHQTTDKNFWFNPVDGSFACFAGHTSNDIVGFLEDKG